MDLNNGTSLVLSEIHKKIIRNRDELTSLFFIL